jgi:hypothetical protein
MRGGYITIMNPNKITLLWIDDNPERKQDADNLEKLDDRISTRFFHPEIFQKKICTKEIVDAVDLFVVDYDLSRKECDSEFYLGKGLSLAGLIRENYSDVPVYLYSGDTDSPIFENLQYTARKEADAVLSLKDIQDEGNRILYSDAMDYRLIRNASTKNVDELIKVLCPPKEEENNIKYILPANLKIKNPGDSEVNLHSGMALDFAAWIRAIFLANPGFVYDSIHAATKIGMTEPAFIERKQHFEDALYTGVFAKTYRHELWWKLSLYDAIFEKTQPSEGKTDVREIVKGLFSLREDEIAKCSVCKSPFPDAVGVDPKNNNPVPVHLRCSKSDPRYTRMMYFEEQRIAFEENE